MGPGVLFWTNVLNSALPPQSLRPDTRPEHQDPVSHMADISTATKGASKHFNSILKVQGPVVSYIINIEFKIYIYYKIKLTIYTLIT